VTGSLGWSVKWLALLLGYHGSKQKGKDLIREAAEKGTLAADDARIILILIHTREKNYQAATQYLAQLKEKYPDNYLVPLDMGGLALLMKQPDRAIAVYQEILKGVDSGSRFKGLERQLLYNRLGVAHREKSDLAGAAAWLERTLKENRASPRAITVARLELGKVYDLLGRRADAVKQYREVRAAADFAGSRDEADHLLQRPFRR
jgi:tetratricopeptide (TPR) repeat protein